MPSTIDNMAAFRRICSSTTTESKLPGREYDAFSESSPGAYAGNSSIDAQIARNLLRPPQTIRLIKVSMVVLAVACGLAADKPMIVARIWSGVSAGPTIRCDQLTQPGNRG
jgi:hypothetical protein